MAALFVYIGVHRKVASVRAELAQVMVPTLIQQAKKDITVRPKSVDDIFDQMGSSKKYLKWYAESEHILPVNVNQGEVFADLLSFLREIERV